MNFLILPLTQRNSCFLNVHKSYTDKMDSTLCLRVGMILS